MAYTLATVRNRILTDKLDDTTYTTSIVDDFINDAQREIFNTHKLPFMEKTFVGSLPSSQFIYIFPTDYQVAQSLVLSDPLGSRKDITKYYVPYNEFNTSFPTPANRTAGTPSIWTSYGNKLFLSQPTDQAYTLSLYYVKKPTTLSDGSDVPEVPEEFQEVLILGAYIRILERNEDFDLATFYRNGAYTDLMNQMASRLGQRQMGTPMRVGQPLRSGTTRHKARR